MASRFACTLPRPEVTRSPARRRPSLRDEHREATRAALLASGRSLFSAQGYHATSLDQIAERARLTKGAVYHHFTNKAELLASVYEALAEELQARIEERITRTTDPAQKAMAAITLLLDAADEADVRAILFRDGPGVLFDQCRRMDEKYFLGVIVRLLDDLQRKKLLAKVDTTVLARLLLSVLIEASVMLGHSENVGKTRVALRVALERLLAGVLTG